MIEELYNKIDKFCNETDWSKYLTYEHALEEFIKEIVEEETKELEKENAELRKVAEFQQSSNMNRHFENKKLKEGLAVGSTFNKALNSMNKNLEEERDKYRNMVFDLQKENAELKELIKNIIRVTWGEGWNYSLDWKVKSEQFLKDCEVEK